MAAGTKTERPGLAGRLKAVLPIAQWLPGYARGWLRLDLLAGLTAAAVVIPKAMAYATIAGLPVEVGLYTALVPMAVYAVLGTSRLLSVSTTSTIAILVAAELGQVASGGHAADLAAAAGTLALLTGVFLFLAGVLRLGFLANFISEPVLVGFKAGLGLVIVLDQLPKLLGVHVAKVGFFRDVWAILQHVPASSIPTLVLAAAMLAILFGLEHFVPRAPAPLVAVVVGIAAAGLLGLKEAGVALAGNVPKGIPAPVWPDLSMARVLWPGALGIALMSFAESIAAGRAFIRHGDPRPDPNQELRALGLASAAGSLFRTLPAGGGTSQTAVNSSAGARTQVAELATAAVVVGVLLFLAPLIGLMPQATLAAVVIVTTLPLLSLRGFRAILRIRRKEFLWALAACAGVVFLGTLQGILVAAAISVLTLFYQANRPPAYVLGRKPGTDVFRPLCPEHTEDETWPGLLILKTEGRMTFASAPQVGERLWAMVHKAKPKVLVLDCSAIPDFEYTALSMLTQAEEKLRAMGITLWLAALNPEPLRVIERAPLGKTLGRERMFFNLQQAVETYLGGLEHATNE